MECFVHQSKVKQYADNTTKSLVSSDARQLEEGLVDDLEGVARWVEASKLQLNVKKIKLMLLRTCSFHVSLSSNNHTLWTGSFNVGPSFNNTPRHFHSLAPLYSLAINSYQHCPTHLLSAFYKVRESINIVQLILSTFYRVGGRGVLLDWLSWGGWMMCCHLILRSITPQYCHT